MASFNPACYLPSSLAQHLPNSLACPPPPSYLSSVLSSFTSPFSSTFTTMRTLKNALVSLPFLSFLLIPTTMSYSTSLNLLLFYITWSTLILSHPPLRVEAISTLAVRTVFYLAPSTLFFVFDALLPSAAQSLKSMGTEGLPLHRAHRRRQLWVTRIVSWSVFNVLLSILLQMAFESLLTTVLQRPSALKITTTLPLPWAIAKDLIRGYLLRDFLSYTFHRYLLHHPSSPLSYPHRTWYHTIPTPFPLTATYDHPLAFLSHSFLPTFLPAYIFRFHLLTYLLYLTLISLEETFAYSGYSTVPTNFVLGGIARRTDGHVLCGGEGNYGCLGLCDWIMGTTAGRDTDVLDDMLDEVDSHDLNGRLHRGVQSGIKQVTRRKKNIKQPDVPRPRRTTNGSDPDGSSPGGPRRRTRKKIQDIAYDDDD